MRLVLALLVSVFSDFLFYFKDLFLGGINTEAIELIQ